MNKNEIIKDLKADCVNLYITLKLIKDDYLRENKTSDDFERMLYRIHDIISDLSDRSGYLNVNDEICIYPVYCLYKDFIVLSNNKYNREIERSVFVEPPGMLNYNVILKGVNFKKINYEKMQEFIRMVFMSDFAYFTHLKNINHIKTDLEFAEIIYKYSYNLKTIFSLHMKNNKIKEIEKKKNIINKIIDDLVFKAF